MATVDNPRSRQSHSGLKYLEYILRPLASLRLTVGLFAIGLFIVLIGTLAQVEKNEFTATQEIFYAPFFWLKLQWLFPKAFFPNLPDVPGQLPFIGGMTIAVLLAANLLAAHMVRFKIQAKGPRLAWGIGVGIASLLLLFLVVSNSHNSEGLQGKPPFDWQLLWYGVVAVMVACTGAFAAGAYFLKGPLRVVSAVFALSMFTLVAWCLYSGAMLGEPALRIVWQLVQGGVVGVVLWFSGVMLFKKRAGVFVIHAGVGLLMFSQFLFGRSLEENMSLEEGQTVNYASEINKVEMAIIDATGEEQDDVVVIPHKMLMKSKSIIDHDDLPFKVDVVDMFPNSNVLSIKNSPKKDTGPVTAGYGKHWIVESRERGTGTSNNRKIDRPSMYVRLISKEDGEDIGTYMLTTFAGRPQPVRVGDKVYDLFLRLKRNYKPFSLYLHDARKEEYVGTSTARAFESHVQLVSAEHQKDDRHKTWMNNPLRYAGQTFYQSDFFPLGDGTEVTGLQVVTNTGWMIPYIACMIVAIGMLGHFSETLVRFLRRRERQLSTAKFSPDSVDLQLPKQPSSTSSALGALKWVLPGVIMLTFGLAVARGITPTKTVDGELNLYEAGRLPIAFGGRVKPLDSLARDALRVISDSESFTKVTLDKKGKVIDKERLPAIQWLLDVMCKQDEARDHRVFRIHNYDVLELLELKPRKGYRYSVAELLPNIQVFEERMRKVRSKDDKTWDLFDRKCVELDNRINTFMRLHRALVVPVQLPSIEEIRKQPQLFVRARQELEMAIPALKRDLDRMKQRSGPPQLVPLPSDDDEEDDKKKKDDWGTYSQLAIAAYFYDVEANFLGRPATKPPGYDAVSNLTSVIQAYQKGKSLEFNRAVRNYHTFLSEKMPSLASQTSRNGLEAAFNKANIFFYCKMLYILAFILGAVAWLKWGKMLNFAAYSVLTFTFVLHTFGLVSRIMISGRPPVTNLYSSAVFIGWGIIGLTLVIEAIYKLGIGNVIAAVLGFFTLLIAKALGKDGDTMEVLVAVLDTQFWLATHVTCITFGYSTMFLAGALGIGYLICTWLSIMSAELSKEIARMIYGVVCFAIFFSFVGTVLGGLWADDSWGRFWGWDPKENGALMIVIWNAIVLHARWGGMVKDRGMAVLAIGGNIVTAWSWFGVNELNIGLHSYGFTQGRLFVLCMVALGHLAFIIVGMTPVSSPNNSQRLRRTA